MQFKPRFYVKVPYLSDASERIQLLGAYKGPALPASVHHFLCRRAIDKAVQYVRKHFVIRLSDSWHSFSYPTGIRIAGAPGSATATLEMDPRYIVRVTVFFSLTYQGHPLSPWGKKYMLRIIDEGQGCFFHCT
jgi:hypothetical protein